MAFRFLDRYRPFTNGGAVVPSRPIARGSSPRELALERELAALRAQQDALAKQERAAAANLADMQDALDVLAGEIDVLARRTRDHQLRENGAAMVANVKAWASKQDGVGHNTARAAVEAIKAALGLELSRHRFAAPRPQGAVVPIDPTRLAADIVTAGRKARAELPPSPPADPTAAGIVAAGRRARNEPPDE